MSERSARRLIVTFDEPANGWSRLELLFNGEVFKEPFSHIYPTLGELCGALCDLLAGHEGRRVVFLLEPAELELTLTPLAGGTARVSLRLFKDRRRTSSDGDLVTEFVGERHEIVLAFWRALRRLQTGLSDSHFEERWRAPFPRLEMASLTECLSERGL